MDLPRHPLRHPFLSRLDENLRRGLAVPEGATLRVALSGGADSAALLAGLTALAPVRGYTVVGCHVHHGLQAQADTWAARCRDLGAALEVPVTVRHWQGAPAAEESEEAAARRARYELLAAALGEGEWLLTAHHADDQAETVLLYLARGAGLDGLSGIEPRRPFATGWLARPLLPFRRADTEAFAAEVGWEPVADPSNEDPARFRARIRHALLPCFEEVAGPGSVAAAARSAGHLQDARAVLEGAVASALAPLWRDGPALDIPGLAALEAPLARLVLREALRRAGQPLPETDRLEAVRAVTGHVGGDGQVAWPGGGVHRCGPRLVLAPAPEPRAPAQPAAWPVGETRVRWPALGLTVVAEWGARSPDAAAGSGYWLRAGSLAEGACLRPPRPGERLRPAGRDHHRPLKELLREAGVPATLRPAVPVLTDDAGQVLAVPGLVTGVGAAPDAGEPAWQLHLHWDGSPAWDRSPAP